MPSWCHFASHTLQSLNLTATIPLCTLHFAQIQQRLCDIAGKAAVQNAIVHLLKQTPASTSVEGEGTPHVGDELAHAAFCTDPNCEQSNCRRMKAKLSRLQAHAASCAEPQCTPCKIWNALQKQRSRKGDDGLQEAPAGSIGGSSTSAIPPTATTGASTHEAGQPTAVARSHPAHPVSADDGPRTADSSTSGPDSDGGAASEAPTEAGLGADDAAPAAPRPSTAKERRRQLIAHVFTCLQPVCNFPQCGPFRRKLNTLAPHAVACTLEQCDDCQIWNIYNYHLRRTYAKQQERMCGGSLEPAALSSLALLGSGNGLGACTACGESSGAGGALSSLCALGSGAGGPHSSGGLGSGLGGGLGGGLDGGLAAALGGYGVSAATDGYALETALALGADGGALKRSRTGESVALSARLGGLGGGYGTLDAALGREPQAAAGGPKRMKREGGGSSGGGGGRGSAASHQYRVGERVMVRASAVGQAGGTASDAAGGGGSSSAERSSSEWKAASVLQVCRDRVLVQPEGPASGGSGARLAARWLPTLAEASPLAMPLATSLPFASPLASSFASRLAPLHDESMAALSAVRPLTEADQLALAAEAAEDDTTFESGCLVDVESERAENGYQPLLEREEPQRATTSHDEPGGARMRLHDPHRAPARPREGAEDAR